MPGNVLRNSRFLANRSHLSWYTAKGLSCTKHDKRHSSMPRSWAKYTIVVGFWRQLVTDTSSHNSKAMRSKQVQMLYRLSTVCFPE